MRHHTRLLILALLALLAFGTACGSSEPAEEEVEPAASESAASESAPSEPETEERSAQTAPSGNPGLEQAPGEMAGLEQFRAALHAAANAEGDSPCERSYNGILAMIAAMPETDPAESGVPTPEAFIEGCSRLPEAAQTCLNPGYGVQHPECRETLESPAVQAFAQAVSGEPAAGRPGTPPSGLPQASPGATPCERAYNGMQAMLDSMPDARGAQMPDRARYMAACAELPEETAQCADPAYGVGHPECMQWLGTPAAVAFRNAIQTN